MILTYDYIGGAQYIDRIIKYHPPGFGLRFLISDGTGEWNDGLKAGRKFLKARQDVPIIGFHGTWHDDHIFNAEDVPRAVRHAKRVAKLNEEFPGISKVYSPWLEPDACASIKKEVYQRCKVILRPHCIPVVVPETSLIDEVHHSLYIPPGRYIFSFDGLDMLTEADVKYWKNYNKDAWLFCGWCFQCNGKRNRNDPRPRSERTNYMRRRHFRRMERKLKI